MHNVDITLILCDQTKEFQLPNPSCRQYSPRFPEVLRNSLSASNGGLGIPGLERANNRALSIISRNRKT